MPSVLLAYLNGIIGTYALHVWQYCILEFLNSCDAHYGLKGLLSSILPFSFRFFLHISCYSISPLFVGYRLDFPHTNNRHSLHAAKTSVISVVQITEKQHPAHQEVRRDLRKCFRDINCYLMPHPGFKVIQKKDFDGRLRGEYILVFCSSLRISIKFILSTEGKL